MSEENINNSETMKENSSEELVVETTKIEREPNRLFANRKIFIIGSLILLIVALILIFIFLRDDQSGKPVPAPRTVSFGENDNETNAPTAERTITLSDDQIKAAGLKIETVGESLAGESFETSATGVVQANAYAETPVISLVGGVVRGLNAELGQFVQKGQTVAIIYSDELSATQSNYLSKLAETDEASKRYDRAVKLTDIAAESRTELDTATAEVKAAEAEVAEYKSNFERTTKLLKIGAASRQELEQATTKLKTAEASLVEAKNRLERARKLLNINPQRRAELDNALTQLRKAEAETSAERQRLLVLGLSPQAVERVKNTRQVSSELPLASPVSGTVTARMVNNGEIVSANKELLKVTNLSTVWVIGQVYEKDLGKLRIGSGASVTTDAYPGQVFRGNISYIDPNLDQSTRTAQVRIELPNPDQKFKVGMYVNIAFATIGGSEDTVPVVPKEAIQNLNNQQVVFVATENPNMFIVRPIRIGAETGGLYPVLEGLTVGEKIVTDGSFLLYAELQKTNSAAN
ncbi:hypothetical protein BH20ACI4_BH20ACI4_27490 [soil metagenome]